MNALENDKAVLVVDDEEGVRKGLARVLRDEGYRVRLAASQGGALQEIARELPHLVLLDLRLPDGSGLDVYRKLKGAHPGISVIPMTAYRENLEKVQERDWDGIECLEKPFENETLRLRVREAFLGIEEEVISRTDGAGNGKEMEQGRMVACAPSMRKVVGFLERLPSCGDYSVLIEGETGTGKEVLAREIHLKRNPSGAPFLAMSCGAVPRDLVESELFGYSHGAFTGARTGGKPGLFEQARSGTVLLDELGEMEPAVQVKMLRVLETREYCRVGGTDVYPLRAQILAATNRNLRKEVQAGRFRADLYYRLNVLKVRIPPLRERKEDIFSIGRMFLEDFGRKYRKPYAGFSTEVFELLRSWHWPGNIRELRNVIERAVLLGSGEGKVQVEDLPEHIRRKGRRSERTGEEVFPEEEKEKWGEGGESLSFMEQEGIVKVLKKTGCNVVEAARVLGIKRGALRYRMQKYGISRCCEAAVLDRKGKCGEGIPLCGKCCRTGCTKEGDPGMQEKASVPCCPLGKKDPALCSQRR